ncbi:BAQ_1a_G0038990.mRNA.1.CDS.1 [Saccharomyces cerevisiae]|nr:BAQ_1a_G0038990.mRNA.1.CDS.1 [Saccharomyces cerevisiae]CAI4675171.1 BAM_G0039020.mRNA.1.CDS.1 [Saccharomyces cerevisiae]CAI7251885.1 BAM_G0039020.mRNA.1.CDS.1 [Saccharomyces cerevisiae]CAI7252280.1 BAQ_1a_G0038990.mRNA.1.CDS.1 [Saccharomyces cerevisiae]
MVDKNRTLHELSSKNFSRTPNGLIFTNDLKTVYSIFLICLDLKEKKHSSDTKSFLLTAFTKHFHFTFTYQEAIKAMGQLELKVDMNTTCINVSYNIKPSLARHLLTLFMSSKLLHTPQDRTRGEPKEKVLFQPTPKGVAVLLKYVRDIGLKTMPDILLSSFNSMKLFTFERSSVTDSIIHSDYLIHILFIKMMGAKPNVWSPTNADDPLPCLSSLLEYTNNDDTFTFEKSKPEQGWQAQIGNIDINDLERVSPLAHRFFTNPDSESHTQYYVSNAGIRLFENKTFGTSKKIVIKYTFTTKAIWQWIMDCTDIMHVKEAVSLAALFLKTGLIVPVLLQPSRTDKKKFQISRSSFFTLSKRGWDLVSWTGCKSNNIRAPNGSTIDLDFTLRGHMTVRDEKKTLDDSEGFSQDMLISSSNLNKLDYVLTDPGMRYLFRRHLEKELCVENLDVFIEIKRFLKKMTILKKLIDSKHCDKKSNTSTSKNNIVKTIDSALIKQANECLEMAYHIYSSYIMIGSPYQLNIHHNLRQNISDIMLHPHSPLSEHFPTNLYDPSPASAESAASSISSTEADTLGEPPEVSLKPSKNLSNENCSFKKQGFKHQLKEYKPAPLTLAETHSPNASVENSHTIVRYGMDNTQNDTKSVDSFPATLKVLRKLYPLFEIVSNEMYRLMNNDSFQKFTQSDVYKDASALIEIQEKC